MLVGTQPVMVGSVVAADCTGGHSRVKGAFGVGFAEDGLAAVRLDPRASAALRTVDYGQAGACPALGPPPPPNPAYSGLEGRASPPRSPWGLVVRGLSGRLRPRGVWRFGCGRVCGAVHVWRFACVQRTSVRSSLGRVSLVRLLFARARDAQPPPCPGGVPPCQSTRGYRHSGVDDRLLWTTHCPVDNPPQSHPTPGRALRAPPRTAPTAGRAPPAPTSRPSPHP